MDVKSVLVGAVTATVLGVSSVSASEPSNSDEKKKQANIMATLLQGVTAVVSQPECTVKK
jgi:hypothetical protein